MSRQHRTMNCNAIWETCGTKLYLNYYISLIVFEENCVTKALLKSIAESNVEVYVV